MTKCLGYRFGTGCMHSTLSTQKQENWDNWQLCYKCARKLHPEYYVGKNSHGVRSTPETRIARIVEESNS